MFFKFTDPQGGIIGMYNSRGVLVGEGRFDKKTLASRVAMRSFFPPFKNALPILLAEFTWFQGESKCLIS